MDDLIETSILRAASPLFAFSRSGIPEIAIHGVGFFKTQAREVGADFHVHDASTLIISRSLLKPWQYLAADVGGAVEDDFWILGLSSHNGESRHVQQLARLAEEAQASENDLFCPRSFPLDWETSARLKLEHAKPVRMHHPCSGKHLLMMASCRKHGDPIDHYWDSEHPMQKRLAALVGRELAEKPYWVQDSCGLPTIAITASAHLNLWERLALNEDESALRMKTLWTANPRLAGGRNRLDSDLIDLGKGRIVAKEGADGLLLVQSLPRAGEPVAGCLIKLASGYNVGHLALALYSILVRTRDLPGVFQDILDYLRSRLENWVPEDQKLLLPPFTS